MEELICSICYSQFDHESHAPLIIHCGHSFCYQCINSTARRTGAIVCPICRGRDYREISVIKKNVLVMHLLGNKKEKPLAPCMDHEDAESMFYCVQDNCPFCSKCVMKHKNHEFYEINDPRVTAGTDVKMAEYISTIDSSLNAVLEMRQQAEQAFNIIQQKKNVAKDNVSKLFEPILQTIEKRKQQILESNNQDFNQILIQLKSAVDDIDPLIIELKTRKIDIEAKNRQMNQLAGNERLRFINQIQGPDEIRIPSMDISQIIERAKGINIDVQNYDVSNLIQLISEIGPSNLQIQSEYTWDIGKVPEPILVNPRMQRLVSQLLSDGINISEKIRRILESTDRQDFMPEERNPYEDRPQCIGFSTTISAPHMHAMTLSMLEEYLIPGSKVVDIGCGSGYLTVCLAKMIERGEVYGVDHIEELINQAVENIRKQNDALFNSTQINVQFICKDGREGLAEFAPFNLIHIGAATETVPQVLIDQLAPGGVLIAPVGTVNQFQRITIIKKGEDGELSTSQLMGVNYAPLTDRHRQCP